MPELATSESLRQLDQRHVEILQALDALCLDVEEVLKKVAPPREPAVPEFQQAA